MDTMSKEQGADVIATIRWPDGSEYDRRLTRDQALALGYRQPEPTAPPAWMVEVAREGAAVRVETTGKNDKAQLFRSGDGDGWEQVGSALAALHLAIERGHVVEAGAASSAAAADLQTVARKAWDAGHDRAQVRFEAAAKASLADGLAYDRAQAVSDIVCSLPTREA